MAKARRSGPRRPARKPAPVKVQAQSAPARPPAPEPRPTYLEAVSMYERGLEALRRRDFGRAASMLRDVLDRYPDERELHERVRLYLKICERQAEPPAPRPRTPSERVYAATLAINAGAYDEALEHLQAVTDDDPQNDDAHYMLAVAHTLRGEPQTALPHLRRAIELNGENRALARQDPDLEGIRGTDGFRVLLESLPGPRRRPRSRGTR